jgi:hypothetical protein
MEIPFSKELIAALNAVNVMKIIPTHFISQPACKIRCGAEILVWSFDVSIHISDHVRQSNFVPLDTMFQVMESHDAYFFALWSNIKAATRYLNSYVT